MLSKHAGSGDLPEDDNYGDFAKIDPRVPGKYSIPLKTHLDVFVLGDREAQNLNS